MKNKKKEIRKQILNLVQEYSNIKISDDDKFESVPPSGKLIGVEEISNIVESALDGWLTTGRYNDLFQKKLSNFLNVKNVITVNSGSSANLVAFSTFTSSLLGNRSIKKNDEVISVAAGFPTTVNPIIQNGCIPVFIDIDINTLNIDAEKIEKAINNKTKAIFLAHTLGNPFNLEIITHLCKKYDLYLIEDCCDALGSKYNNQLVGSFGDMATLSFYPAHHITMGEGGAVFTNKSRYKKIAESFRDWGRDCFCEPGKDNTCLKRFGWELGGLPKGYDHKYIYSHLGYNLKITDMQAACGLAQIEKVENFIDTRKKNFDYILRNLKTHEDVFHFVRPTHNSEPSWFGFPLILRENLKFNRQEFLIKLNSMGTGTRLLFAGNITKQPYMSNINYKIFDNLNNTDYIMNNAFWIGLHPALNNDMIDFNLENIRKAIRELY